MAEQSQVERVLLARHAAAAPLGPLSGSDIGFQPDDRQDFRRLGFAEKLDGPVKIAVIGQRQRGHAQRLGALEQVRDLAGAIKKAVVAVAMKMDEGPAGHLGSLVLRLPARLLRPGPFRGCGAIRSSRSRVQHACPHGDQPSLP